ncbi:molecular chaperone Skp [Candidatus Steffania adelgidicola]|uniref:Chaperone protein skp n=1 Tax=Candidatus Steffania adelgidicola str. Klausen-Leopoldsdorf TaxID=994478 RepID=G3ADQ1_9GAMM|nr:molecular chaperone Skp [Candidatus Steffania adelgidicola]UDG80123.1 Chaperone protein Skp [Candidatus Steffania adelgidicola]CCB84911.1 chaperone protein skp [Candidatus Steffania adelgidicola str. Klausen-Leopoldsdorf]
MNNWLYAAGLGLSLTISATSQASDKIAVVNVSRIFQQSPQRAVVSKQLQNEFKGRATELQSMEHNLQTKIRHLQQDSAVMKVSERNTLEKSVIAQREIFAHKAEAFEQDNRRRQTEERNKILHYIQGVVKTVASKEGFDLVIDINVVAYASNTKDITADVLKEVK